ncbi:MAG: PRC-barrel domain-containing protein [Proteobacteria bacterium]|nr:PRC-barrel domain-containing protein [Pseudomonadota bacterium]
MSMPMMKQIAVGIAGLAVLADTTRAAEPPEAGTSQGGGVIDRRTPEEKMRARYPQKVRVGHLIGQPIQDYEDRILGRVGDVMRTKTGKIVLVMRERGWFHSRQLGVPIENVVSVGLHLNLIDAPREAVLTLPEWTAGDARPIDRDEIIRIAIGRR